MNYKNHKHNNTVIEVLDREHGKQSINWWKDQGIDTSNYYGTFNKADKDTKRYYGLKDGVFSNYTLQNCIENIIQIITLPMELYTPTELHIKKEEQKIIVKELEEELRKCTQAHEYLNTVEFIDSLDCNNVLMYLKGREDALKITLNKLN